MLSQKGRYGGVYTVWYQLTAGDTERWEAPQGNLTWCWKLYIPWFGCWRYIYVHIYVKSLILLKISEQGSPYPTCPRIPQQLPFIFRVKPKLEIWSPFPLVSSLSLAHFPDISLLSSFLFPGLCLQIIPLTHLSESYLTLPICVCVPPGCSQNINAAYPSFLPPMFKSNALCAGWESSQEHSNAWH